MADPPLASNNPFRRKSTVPVASTSTSASTSSATGASALTLDTTSPPPIYPIAKSSTFPQSPSDESPATRRALASDSGAPGAAGSLYTSYDDDHEDRAGRPQVSSVDAFREQLQALPKSTEAPPSTTFLKPKPVKKVRVQSPPPSLPSSPSSVDSADADFEARFPSDVSGAAGAGGGAPGASPSFDYAARGGLLDDRPVRNYADYSSESDDSVSDDDDDSANRRSEIAGASSATATSFPTFAQQQPQSSVPAPPNPFQKTLGDLEPEQKSLGEETTEPAATASAGKAPMDVDAFRRLLMTGQGPAPPPARASTADAGSVTDASSTSKHSVFEAPPAAQEATPRTSHEISENDDDRSGLAHGALPAPAQRQTQRKKPPPPSSRHGKLIKAQPNEKEAKEAKPTKEAAGNDEIASSLPSPPPASSDVNKPLPPPPARRTTDDDNTLDSIFDRDAAGKLPDGDVDNERDLDLRMDPPISPPPPAPAAVSSSSSSSHPKRPTPAPPPPRQPHNRTESRSNPQDRPAPHVLLSGEGSTDARDRSPVGSPRSSFDSAPSRSRSSSLIKAATTANATGPPPANTNTNTNVPAPPPPRRVNHASRPSTATAGATPSSSSPPALPDSERAPPPPGSGPAPASTWSIGGAGSHVVFASTPNLLPPHSASATNSGTSTPVPVPGRLAKPPPPPARNTSVRNKEGRPGALVAAATEHGGSYHSSHSNSGRPSSVMSVDAISRRVGGGSQMAPPPPPPTRQRGSSRGSMDAPAHLASPPLPLSAAASSTPRQVSSESVRRSAAAGTGQNHLAPADESDEADSNDNNNNNSEMASHILADLDALRREVDALRGQFKADQ
ncbi:hypothetical protein SBRCBS47491_000711 [Sporothrix bragantina]|uniref:Proteophosphoglycan ppg4 n=1 Tax=Sporothrix bragantina TaxID=671064 RepID=A0ABP0ASQ2_9PEZI